MARFVLSKSKVISRFGEAKELADEVSYSLKTNPEVGKVLEQETDCCFSVHSLPLLSEIVDKSRVWFFAQAWNPKLLTKLTSIGVRRFVVDNSADLSVLLAFLKGYRGKVDLMLRMRLKEQTIHTGKHFVFGMYGREIGEHIPKLRENNKIQSLGVHFHRKTQNISEWSLVEDFSAAVGDDIAKMLDVVDIGGGLPVEYKNSRVEVMVGIKRRIMAFREWLAKRDVKMIVEPGRFIAGPSLELETKVISVYSNNVVVDASVYNAAMDTFVAHVRLKVRGEAEKGEAYTIKGCTPDSMDIFRYRVYLEKEPKVGDTIFFENAGAYNFSTEFCGLQKISTVITD